ncbi:SDR family oxidoreductase [Sphingomonas aquatilis]|uniref:3-oxoacyl-[acyl-carrier protein] reductase n=1 Tax=Sphingomonas aquatilis TaxID=93063 RepID=A0AAW3TQK6_9SPHN|nr:SDR family oxidoreductase [Sphingomonas aquatilis]MBB3874986.1 3-oxoacyl-[acyl-carrier protein] reductase [Sphingomonas aquatilis]
MATIVHTDATKSRGRTAIVTGGGRGIGAAVARRLASDGANVVISYARSRDSALRTCDEIGRSGGRAVALAADAADPQSGTALFDAADEHFGGADILVNNAGVGHLAPFAGTDEGAYDRLFSITKGTFFTLQCAARRLRDGGRIVSVSTGLTRNWAQMAAAYAGSKAAIEQFSRSLSRELGPRGITVNVVSPGVVTTDMTAAMPLQMKEAAAAQTSLGRLGRPDDIADVIGFLCSPDARWITGQVVAANGGSTP